MCFLGLDDDGELKGNFVLFFPTFFKMEVLVRCLQIVISRFHLLFANFRWE